MESFVQVTQGDDAKLHTVERPLGLNDVHDSVTLLGEPYRATYSVVASAVSTALNGGRLLSIFAGPDLPVRVWYVSVSQVALAGAAGRADIFLQRTTASGTAGTAANITKHDNADADPDFTAESLHQGSTVAGVFGRGALTLASAHPIIAPNAEFDFRNGHHKPIVIPAGTSNGLAVIIGTGIATSTVHVAAIVDEGDY